MLIDWLPQALQEFCRHRQAARKLRRRTVPMSYLLNVEKLEERALLSAGPVSQTQIVSQLDNNSVPSTGSTGTPVANGAQVSNPLDQYIARDSSGRIGVRVTAQDVYTASSYLQSIGFVVTGSSSANHLVEGFIAANKIGQLSGHSILGVVPIYQPVTHAGSTTSQADYTLQSDRIRNTYPPGYDGTGVTVGILSDSFNSGGANPIAGVNSGDLPSNVNIISDGVYGSTDEGRAMGELVHDVAPGANLAFATAFNGEASFAQAILDLANPAIGNADIIVDDVGYLTEPMFQDGIIAQAVNQVVNYQGIPYFSAAGNNASNSYEVTNPTFTTDSDPDSLFFTSLPGQWLDFDPSATGVDTRNRIDLGAFGGTITLSLQWDDPFYTTSGVDTDLDIFLVDPSTGQILFSSTSNNIATQTPNEIVGVTLSGLGFFNSEVDVMIRLESGPAPGRIKWVDFGSGGVPQWDTQSSTIYGHPAATGAMAVGASAYYDAKNAESFTSAGPTTILFSPTGGPLGTPDVRATPQITAVDGTNTTFFTGGTYATGTGVDVEHDGLPNFFGTSAAAPVAAAVAALIKQGNPAFTPNQIYTRLIDSAEDVGDTGFDNLTGYGVIDAWRAIYGNATTVFPNFAESGEGATLGGYWEVNTFGGGRVTQTSALGSTSGSQSLVLRSSLDGIDYGTLAQVASNNNFYQDPNSNRMGSLSESILHLDLAGLTDDVFLSFDVKQTFNPLIPTVPSSFADDLQEPMSQIFQGHEGSDGVAISVDGGVTWYRLRSLTDQNIGPNFVHNQINLTQFANQNGFSLGSDVQVKFQQFDQLGFYFDFGGGTTFSFLSPNFKSIRQAGQLPIETNGIVLDNVQIFNNLGPIVAFAGATTSYRVGAPPVFIDPSSTVLDTETPNFDGGIMTIALAANGTASDRLEIQSDTSGSIANRISTSGNRVMYGGAEIGTFVGGSLGNPLVITLNQNATPSITQNLLRHISFRTTSNSLLARSVQVVISDGAGGVSTPVTKTITLQAGGNSAPQVVLSPSSLAVSRGASATLIDDTATVVDPDSANFDGGILRIKVSANASSSDRLEVHNEGNGAGQIGISGTTIKYQGVTIGTLTGSTTDRSIKLNSAATPEAIQALVRNITFRTISTSAPLATRTVQFQLTDGDGGVSDFANKSVSVVTRNIAPTVTLSSSIPSFRLSTGTPVLIDSAATVTDTDSRDFNGGQLRIQITSNVNPADVLTIRNQGASTGRISISGTSVLYGGIVIGTVTGGTGNSALVITFNGNATASSTRALLRNITFATGGTSPSLLQRQVTITLTDGDGGTSRAVTKNITVRT